MVLPDDSFEWPKVSAELEKRRYEQARAFLSVIEPSSKPSPDIRKLKSSYESAVAAAKDDLYRAIGRVAYLTERDQKILDNIVRLCSQIWLECCSQRYRLIMIMPDGLANPLSDSRREVRTLRLLVKPDIKRFGTSQGDDLATGEAVTGWKGLVERYPQR